MANIPFLDLKKQYKIINKEIKEAVKRVLESGSFVLGDNVQKLEKEIASYCKVKYAVGVASGTDALEISLRALGIGKGDEVITTPFTFIATVEAICKVGAKPVFADINSRTYLINTSEIKKKITRRTKVIIPVHLYGQACNMRDILVLAKKNNLFVIEDAAQALGAEYHNKKVGSLSDLGIFSFFPTKNLGGCGDGGMIVTSSKKLNDKIRMLRVHGSKKGYDHLISGYNSRLDELQAAILLVKFPYLNKWNNKRCKVAYYYNRLFKGLENEVITPYENKANKHVYNVYTLRVSLRDKLNKFLKEKGISTSIYYPIPLHLQRVYKNFKFKKNDFPVTEEASKEVLSLPIYPELAKCQQRVIVKNILDFYKRQRSK